MLRQLSFLAYIALAVIVGKKDGSVNEIAYVSALPYFESELRLYALLTENFAQISSIESTIYCPIIVIVKISILLQYVTVFVVHRGSTFHYTVHGLIWANVTYYTIATFLHIFHVSISISSPLVVSLETFKRC